MLLSRCYVILLVAFITLIQFTDAKSPCDICKDIVSSFKSGLEKTVKSNFGGGNTNWEENSLGKWDTSETRLVEIIDHHICQGNDKQCHMFFERNEEHIEDWYFNKYKDLLSADTLHNHLCIEYSKACCPEGKYGPSCTDCPSDEGKVCGGHGKCQGDGTRTGDGNCKCISGYEGSRCEECEENYYEQLTGSIRLCLACHESCEDSCTGGEPIACDDCKDGYLWDESLGCQDVDECTGEDDPCMSTERSYCSNSIGSYQCKSCHQTCQSCTGGESAGCTECMAGYEREVTDSETSPCQDVDECALRPDLCTSIKGAQCTNTAGSYDCRCSLDNQRIEGAKCVDIVEPTEQVVEEVNGAANAESVDKADNSRRDNTDKSKKGKRTTRAAKSSKPVVSGDDGQAKIDIDAMMNEAGGLPPGQKRKYRTLDSMVLTSATGLYLVMCLVFNAEFFKTSLVTAMYSFFIYKYAGQYV